MENLSGGEPENPEEPIKPEAKRMRIRGGKK